MERAHHISEATDRVLHCLKFCQVSKYNFRNVNCYFPNIYRNNLSTVILKAVVLDVSVMLKKQMANNQTLWFVTDLRDMLKRCQFTNVS